MNKKYLIITLCCLILALGVVLFLWPREEEAHLQHKNRTRETQSPRPDPFGPRAPQKIARPTLSPSPSPVSSGKEEIYIGDRQVVGPGLTDYAKKPRVGRLRIQNDINPNWESNLINFLYKYQTEQVKIDIKREKSLISVYGNRGKYIEKVIITTKLPSGKLYSYHAHVDSGTGQILETWNKTLHETPARNQEPLVPTGSI